MNDMDKRIRTLESELDKQVIEGCASGWMESNTSKTRGDINTCEKTAFHLTREKRFRIDSQDMDEKGFFFSAADVLAEFQRTRIIPEIDSYRYSKLAELADTELTYTPTKETICSQLTKEINEVRIKVGEETDLVISMARSVYDILLLSSESSKNTLEVKEFQQGDRKIWVNSINGADIIPVPSARMKTSYTFDDYYGATINADAKQINWIICPKTAPVAVSQTTQLKITTPEQNQFADAWDIDYRKCNNLFVSDENRVFIATCVS